MKTTGKVAGKGLSFGFSAVNAGQRNTSAEPQLIVVSTEGGFRLTPAVTKVLGIGHGDYVMFVSNVDAIDEAIRNQQPELVEFANEAGLEITDPEALVLIHKEFDSFAIAKGILEFDPKGNIRQATERLTQGDRQRFVATNFDAMLQGALASDDAELVDALSRDGITKEEQSEILTKFVTPKEVNKFKGSKAANPGGQTGAGTSLTFTDSNVWNQIKSDLKEDKTKVNRVFDIDLDNIQTIEISNGYEMVEVKIIELGASVDKEPARIGSKEAAEEAVEA